MRAISWKPYCYRRLNPDNNGCITLERITVPSAESPSDKIHSVAEVMPQRDSTEGISDSSLNEAPRYDAEAMFQSFCEFQDGSVREDCPPAVGQAIYIAFEAGWKRCLRDGQPR